MYTMNPPDDEHNCSKHVEEVDKYNKQMVH